MNLEKVRISLGIEDCREILQPHREESVACLPALGPAFLDPTEIAAHRALVGLPAESDPLLLETAQGIRKNPGLLHLV